MGTLLYDDALSEALQRLEGLGYERGENGDLANHGPMGAEALAVLGFGDAVRNWVEGYKRAMPHHDPPEPRFGIDPTDESSWREALGQFHRAGDWEMLFRRQLAEEPWQRVVGRWWPRLLPGLLAGLTHGLIRTAHAVRAVAATEPPSELALVELARGMAYWAARYTGLPGDTGLVGQRRVADAVARLPRPDAEGTITPPQAGQRLQRVRLQEDTEEFPGYFGSLRELAPDSAHRMLSEMTSTFAGVYLAHPEVFPVPLIHGVTAPAAIRLVLPHLPEEQHLPSVAAMWRVHVALLLAFTKDGTAEQQSLAIARTTEFPSGAQLLNQALEHGDEHVIKLAEACQREHALRPDPRYPAAAFAAQQRIEPRPTKTG
ncbi:questin oxidase family protein [Actinopolyspora mortivallis]|uniref:DUF4243 domain-containing protein n=1 Tax=Actinopolyspora mortivallis TaxID=33906 RepID=A0A2T0GYP0_ACTMO|nr:questin oxidase family protein [Actinopolyspora mortivallis]PRW64226.1 hypothetical protein CEP50_06210 [Actinopolyspora mortivallis]